MKRVLTVLGVVLLVNFGGRALYRTLASDEQKIRWALEDMFEGYNTAQPRLCVGPLAEDWRHETMPELDRELLRGALFRISMQERDRESRKLTTRVMMEPDSLSITLDEDVAELELEAYTERRVRGGSEEPPGWEERWRFHVTARLHRGDEGWKILSSRHEDLVGTQLSR